MGAFLLFSDYSDDFDGGWYVGLAGGLGPPTLALPLEGRGFLGVFLLFSDYSGDFDGGWYVGLAGGLGAPTLTLPLEGRGFLDFGGV